MTGDRDAEHPPPVVSVIIPTYNRSGVLRFAIESVLWQRLSDFELLVIGDGCTDDSADVVASFADRRLHWHNLPVNSGNQSAPNNAGLEMARGRYVAYLGHDDIWLPDHLDRHVEVMTRTGADLTHSWIEMIGPAPHRRRQITGISASDAYDGTGVLPPSSVMHTRAMAAAIGPWKDYRTIIGPPDQEFVARAFSGGSKFAPVGRLTVLKFNAAWRPGCYAEKPVQEQADAMLRIRNDRDFLCDELHALIEALVRAHADEMPTVLRLPAASQPGALVEHTRQLRGLEPKPLDAIRRPDLFPPVPARLDLASDSATPWLRAGWSWGEPRFRWTEGPEASLVFGLDTIDEMEMQLRLAPFLASKKLQSQRVVIRCNDQDVAQLLFTDPEMAVCSVRLTHKVLRRENVIVFHMPDAGVPLALGESLDARRLGIRVEWITFRQL